MITELKEVCVFCQLIVKYIYHKDVNVYMFRYIVCLTCFIIHRKEYGGVDLIFYFVSKFDYKLIFYFGETTDTDSAWKKVDFIIIYSYIFH